MTNLTELAVAAYTANELHLAEQEVADEENHRQEIVAYAAAFALKVLGDAAKDLVFEWATAEDPDDVAAQATLPGSPRFHLSYEFSGTDETSRLLLVRPCSHCGHVAVDEIQSLPHLGNLLTD
jgi:hypothetical protein